MDRMQEIEHLAELSWVNIVWKTREVYQHGYNIDRARAYAQKKQDMQK